MEKEIPIEAEKLENLLHPTTINDMNALHVIAKGCGMKIALSEFIERDGKPRLYRIVLVNYDFDR